MIAIFSLLAKDGSNAIDVYNVLSALSPATQEGCEACLHVLDLYRNTSPEVAGIVLAGLLLAPSLTPVDHVALQSLTAVLGVRQGDNEGWSEVGLKVVTEYLEAQYAEIFAEAQRLEAMRAVLKCADLHGTSQLLASAGIEDPSPIEDALSSLPPELINVVEKVGNHTVEMLFPLTHLTQLQRIGFGLGKAQSLLVHFIVPEHGIPPGFCLHFDTDGNGKGKVKSGSLDHYPWMIFSGSGDPDSPLCHGETSPTKYQLARTISRHLVEGFKSLEDVHILVSGALKDLGKNCVTCGGSHGVQLRGPAVCKLPLCTRSFRRASVEVRFSLIRQDPTAVDALLSMVHLAASTGKLELLPECPFDSTATVLKLLNTVPAMQFLHSCKDLTTTTKGLGGETVKLLLWVCTAYRGLLSSAKDSLRIPSMPAGTHQFLLASSNPEHEAAFAAHLTNTPQTRVLFHGTSVDRLFAITMQGLRVLSSTSLQAHGAAAGPGIYCAEEPSMSWGYSGRGAQAGANWAQSQLRNFRVLLGVENAGPSVGNGGMHVVTDPTSLCVRYVFLVPDGTATVPIAAHVVPAMGSVFASLRSGAL